MRRLLACALTALVGCSSASTPPPDKLAAPPPPAETAPRDPVFWRTATAIQTRCASDLALSQEHRATTVEAQGTEAALVAFNRLLTLMQDLSGRMELVAAVHPDEATRVAAETCGQELRAFLTDVGLDPDVYQALSAVDTSSAAAGAERFLEKQLLAFRLTGVDQDKATRVRLKALDEEMTKLGQAFERNIREDTRVIKVEPAKLKGLPSDFIAAHPPNQDGLVELTTNYPDYFPVQTYVEDESVRRNLARAFLSRAYPDNEKILRRLLQLRAEYASLLGYPSWADYSAQGKMAGSAKAIYAFTDEVAKLARPRMKKDLEALMEAKKKEKRKARRFKRRHSRRGMAVRVWDRFYLAEKVRRARFNVDASETRAYFEYGRVLAGIIDLFGELFGLTFTLEENAPVWSEGVVRYRVSQDGQLIGSFYLDMHPRAGKYKHAAMFPLQTGIAGQQPPEAALVCNFPNPKTGSALMEHTQVVTFFHEFGHLLHHLLGGGSTEWANLSGTNVEWDFVEAPSQLLEEWAWSPAVLQRFAIHNVTEEPIPTELVERMRAANEFGKGVHVMRQVFYQAMSLHLHDTLGKGVDILAKTKALQTQYSPYPYEKGTHVYASFGHLNGYSSMYYTYQWSLARAKDMFTRFDQDGLTSVVVASDYLKYVLKPGGTKPAEKLVQDFLRRPSRLDAYRDWLEK